MDITFQIIAKENNDLLKKTLSEVMSYSCPIVIGDLSGNLNQYKSIAKVERLYLNKDYSIIRNQCNKMIQTEWIFYIKPGESITNFEDVKLSNKSQKISLINNGIITKETRIYKKNSIFKYPIFEYIENDQFEVSNIIILSKNTSQYTKDDIDIINFWKTQEPFNPDPYYYYACYLLYNKNYQEFIKTSDHYFFLNKKFNISELILKYYNSMVKLCVFNDFKSSISLILQCIEYNPLMAEFWCLLGDIYFKLNEYKKSLSFYENAILLGSRRKNNDLYPLDISKYKNYPENKIKLCNKIIDSLIAIKF